VNNSDPENTTPPLDLSPQEIKLLEQMRAAPVMAEKFRQIMGRFEQEIASGTDANEAEMMVIEELRDLGRTLLGEWARTTHDKAVAAARAGEPDLIRHSKKNSTGTPPLEPSA